MIFWWFIEGVFAIRPGESDKWFDVRGIRDSCQRARGGGAVAEDRLQYTEQGTLQLAYLHIPWYYFLVNIRVVPDVYIK